MTVITNAKDVQQYERKLSLIVDQIFVFNSSPNTIKEVKNLSLIASYFFMLLNVFIRIVRSIFSLTFKQSHQKLLTYSLYIFDIICNFL